MFSRSAIQSRVIVVSPRRRRARPTFCRSPLRRRASSFRPSPGAQVLPPPAAPPGPPRFPAAPRRHDAGPVARPFAPATPPGIPGRPNTSRGGFASIGRVGFEPLLFHPSRQFPPAGRAVPGNSVFPQQPVHPQPRGPLSGRPQKSRITAPRMVLQRLFRCDQFRPRRIQMDIIANGLQIPVAAAVHDQRLVTPAKQMAEEFMPAVEPAGAGAQQPFHPGHQVSPQRFHHQMKVMAHEAIRVDLPAGFRAGFAQSVQKPLPVRVILENGLPPVPAIHDMIDRPGIFHLGFLAMKPIL